ncbi:uncharacterized protein LOC115319385 isoform X1 [Ixodes scapularis]|uniref:uncharacterized protein LOC115319385 isoform X1 n=1 Tax=Ixodes scapularis TaxID=6945 RepID=UPI001C3904FC|nr:uncharacterized protein LOC115319385 isoform X1 [Ixodes scapularis]
MPYGNYCCVLWCANNGKTNKKPGVKFFRIPRDSRSKTWVRYSERPELAGKTATQLNVGYRMCSEHFTTKDFMDPGQTRLTKTAVPTVRPQTSRLSAITEAPVATRSLCDMEGSITSPSTAAHVPVATTSLCGVEGSITSPSTAAHVPVATTSLCDADHSITSPSTAAHEQMPVSSSPDELFDHSAPSTPSSSGSRSELPGACSGRSTPSSTKCTRRLRDIIKHLRAKVSSYRKTIARLRKEQKQMPRSVLEALEMVRPFVSEQVFELISSQAKLRCKGRQKRFPLWLKKFA